MQDYFDFLYYFGYFYGKCFFNYEEKRENDGGGV